MVRKSTGNKMNVNPLCLKSHFFLIPAGMSGCQGMSKANILGYIVASYGLIQV